jgi:hypothetical protein
MARRPHSVFEVISRGLAKAAEHILEMPERAARVVHNDRPERLDTAIKRRTSVVGVGRKTLPPEGLVVPPTPSNDAAIARLVGALLLEQNDE